MACDISPVGMFVILYIHQMDCILLLLFVLLRCWTFWPWQILLNIILKPGFNFAYGLKLAARYKGHILNSGKILLFDKAAQMHLLVEWIEWIKLNRIEMNQLFNETFFLQGEILSTIRWNFSFNVICSCIVYLATNISSRVGLIQSLLCTSESYWRNYAIVNC